MVTDAYSGSPRFGSFADSLIEFIATEVAAVPTPDEPVDTSTDLLLTGLVDSLGVVRIVNWIEAYFDVTIDAADIILEHFQSVDAMVRFLADTMKP